MAAEFEFSAKQVKKMDNPIEALEKTGSKKYLCYVGLNDVPDGFADWMSTNPREQNLNTNVARSIRQSIEDGKDNFHEINRGIVMSVERFSYDNKTGKVKVTLEDPAVHGNIDGGHTLRIILEKKKKNEIHYEQYVFFEFFTGIQSPADLAEARNTSVQVDTRSIEELKKTFDCIKNALADEPFLSRVAFKQNEHAGEKNIIDVQEIIAIINMYNQALYPIDSDSQPIQSYTGKAASLSRFLKLKGNKQIISNMTPIIPDIFKLWDMIETSFADKGRTVNRIYRRKKYAKHGSDEGYVQNTMFGNTQIDYFVPKGLMYPIVGAFRALVTVDKSSQQYGWKIPPLKVWEEIGGRLVNIVMTSSEDLSDSPDAVGKSPNTWNLLFKEVLIYSMMHANV